MFNFKGFLIFNILLNASLIKIYSFTVPCSIFKDTLKTFDDFKSKQKSVWSNIFWYVKLYTEAIVQRCSVEKVFLRDFGKFTGGNTCAREHLFYRTPLVAAWNIYSENLCSTLYIEIKKMFKKFLWNKINVTKKLLFFLSLALTHHNMFTFNSQSLHELTDKDKAYVGFSILDSVSFLSKFIYLFIKKHGLFDFKTS